MNLLVRPRVNIISYIHIIIKCNETIKNTTLIASKIIIKKMNKVHFYFIILGFEANLNNRENIIYL